MGKNNIIPIINYQDDRQMTPSEALTDLMEKAKNGEVENLFMLYTNGSDLAYTPASISRDYKKMEILWHIEQFKSWFLEDNS